MSDVLVPFVDLKQRFAEEREELLSAVSDVLERGDLIGGAAVTDFEAAAASYAGAAHCIALNSGTDALMMGMMAAGIRRDDEVITPPNSFVASTASIAHIGATPVFCDVGEDQNIDPARIEALITPRTRAIMPVHWTGRMCDMETISAIAETHGLLVIEDSAQSMGASRNGRHGGTWGVVGAFSAHPLKNLNAVGDGGFLFTQSAEIAERLRRYRNHGLADRDTCLEWGVNSRLDTIHAAVLLYRLRRLDDVIERRRRNVELYRSLLVQDDLFIPPYDPQQSDAHVMFIIQCERRDELHAHLTQSGVQSLIYYRRPIHLQPAAAALGYRKGDMPVAERQADRVLALPHHQHLSPEQIEMTANAVNAFYGRS